MTYTITDVAAWLRTTEAQVQRMLDSGRLRSLNRADLETYIDSVCAFFDVERQYDLIVKVWRGYQHDPDDIAWDGAVDALLRCRRRWLVSSPLDPAAYLRKSAIREMGRALARFWRRTVKCVSLPDDVEDKRETTDLEPEPEPELDEYCETTRQRMILDFRLDGMTMTAIAAKLGVDRKTVYLDCQAIRANRAAGRTYEHRLPRTAATPQRPRSRQLQTCRS